MVYSTTQNYAHATASPGCDAPRGRPVPEVTNELAGTPASGSVEQTYDLSTEHCILRRHTDVHIAYWNVRTLLDPAIQTITMHTLWKYNIQIACLSEVRLPDTGHREITVPGTETSYHLYHSGVTDNSGQYGVGIALSKEANFSIIEWNPISPRLAKIRLKGQISPVTVIAVYAPTLNSDDQAKDDFYDALEQTLRNVPSRDMLIVAGDWNARLGSADDTTRHIIGKHTIGDRCANGDRLLNFASANQLVVASTRFQHPRRHLLTWKSNDHTTTSQIDHILMKARWISTVEDCRVYRGATTGSPCGSDHWMGRARLKLRLKAHKRTACSRRYDLTALQTNGVAPFTIELSNRFSALQDLPPQGAEEEWKNMKESIVSAADRHIKRLSRPRRKWISPSTIDLASRSQNARVSGSQQYENLRRQVRNAIRKDKNAYWSALADEAEQAAANGDTRKLYKLVNASRGKGTPISEEIRDSTSNVITNLSERIERWEEHFRSLLHDAPNDIISSHINELQQQATYEVDIEAPTHSEIAEVIGKLKNGKAAGEDGIPAECFKSAKGVLTDWLLRLITQIWETETVPEDWTNSIIRPVFKKGDKKDCANYRGISLIDVAAKIFSIILLKRFQTERDRRIRPNQSGFRPGRGCTDQIFILRRVLEHRWSFQQPTVACFIDFKAAFDSVKREALWKIMEKDGLPTKLLRLIKAYYTATRTRVGVYGQQSRPIEVLTGVRQGCALSPILFNYVIDWVLSKALADHHGVRINETYALTDLAYADDIVILADSHSAIQNAVDNIVAMSKEVGLSINTSKTKVLSALVPADQRNIISLEGEPIEEVDSFAYLGSKCTATGQGFSDIERRISLARHVFSSLQRNLWSRQEVSVKTKGRIYQAIIRSILLYGSETWAMRVADQRRLEVFDNDCLRRILRRRRSDHIPVSALRSACGMFSLSSVMLQRRLRWFGHVARKPQEEIASKTLHLTPDPTWRRRQGGQTKTWLETIKEDLTLISGPATYGLRSWNNSWLQHSVGLAQDRRAWAAAVRDVVNLREEASSFRPG